MHTKMFKPTFFSFAMPCSFLFRNVLESLLETRPQLVVEYWTSPRQKYTRNTSCGPGSLAHITHHTGSSRLAMLGDMDQQIFWLNWHDCNEECHENRYQFRPHRPHGKLALNNLYCWHDDAGQLKTGHRPNVAVSQSLVNVAPWYCDQCLSSQTGRGYHIGAGVGAGTRMSGESSSSSSATGLD